MMVFFWGSNRMFFRLKELPSYDYVMWIDTDVRWKLSAVTV